MFIHIDITALSRGCSRVIYLVKLGMFSANLTSNNMVVFQMPDGAIIEKLSSLTINIRKFESNFLISPKSVFNPSLNNYYICEFMKCKISANLIGCRSHALSHQLHADSNYFKIL